MENLQIYKDKKVESETIEICSEDDRFVFIQRNQYGEIVGLNFCQGVDLCEVEKYLENDKQIMIAYDFIRNILQSKINNRISKDRVNELDLINEVICLTFEMQAARLEEA